jgi:hypothetical protein
LNDADCPQHVQAFVYNYIDSVVQLEMLLLLYAGQDRSWTSAESARELRVDPAWVEDQFSQLCSRGLLTCEPGSPPSYRYRPTTPELNAAVGDLAKAYADRRVTVISLIYSKPAEKPVEPTKPTTTDPLKSFSEAFRLRKGPNNG